MTKTNATDADADDDSGWPTRRLPTTQPHNTHKQIELTAMLPLDDETTTYSDSAAVSPDTPEKHDVFMDTTEKTMMVDDESIHSHVSNNSSNTEGNGSNVGGSVDGASSSGHFRLEDVVRVRDEATSLRNEICMLRGRLEEVEEERNFHAAKANELTDLVQSLSRVSSHASGDDKTKMDGMHEELVKKSVQIASLTCQVDKLKIEKNQLSQEKAKLQKQRDAARSEMGDLSVIVRSLQTSAYSTDEDDDEDEDSDEEEVVLTPEKALDMTLGNMKAHIEMLEDALQKKTITAKQQKKRIGYLENDNEMNCTKVEMLEELFRELNQERIEEMQRKEEADEKVATLANQQKDSSSTRSIHPLLENSISVPTLNISEKWRDLNSSLSTSLSRGVEGKMKKISTRDIKTSKTSPSLSTATKNQTGGTGKKMNRIKICFKKAGLEGTYTGPLVEGRPHGVGTIRFSNGDTYLGEMNHGKMAGKGTLYTKDNGIFRGQFENNKCVGMTADKKAVEGSSPGRTRRLQRREHDASSDADRNLLRRNSSPHLVETEA